jgi:glycosyltransferase involved in cell wall biosynthesis
MSASSLGALRSSAIPELRGELRKRDAVHITSAHSRNDIRVFLKECSALVEGGWNTTLLVADGKGDEFSDGVSIKDVGSPSSRLRRMTKTPLLLLRKALATDAAIYHLHDPELIPVGLELSRRRKLVVFDSHEDTAKSLLSRSYMVPPIRSAVSRVYALFERWACRRFAGIVTATPSIRDRFSRFHQMVIDVNNYPMASEIDMGSDARRRVPEVCYVGGIARIRGVEQLVDAMDLVTTAARLQLVGSAEDGLIEDMRSRPGWRNVDAHGQLSRQAVSELTRRASIGVVTFLPEPNHVSAQPNKLFEYMAAGLPVIASSFPLWRDIVEGNNCGVCVDPADPSAIAAAIDSLLSAPEVAAAMGVAGRNAVETRYNWQMEKEKLLAFYEALTA